MLLVGCFFVVGILMIFGSVVDAEIPDAVGLIIWVGVELVAVVAGFFCSSGKISKRYN
ncbi:MAG: hypothetical protein CM1200mP37_2030 [Chloroflexota bacterium]|nr:MAG: hypothetical protein CM1200mP37_2030 [Chloroflexota bacterium]